MYSKMPTEFFFQALDGQLYMVNVLKILTLIANKKAKTNRADPDQTASSEAV